MKKMHKIMLAVLMVTAMAFGIAYACESVSLSHSNGLFYGHGNPTSTDGASENDLYLNLDGNTLWQLQRVTTGDGHGHDGVTTCEWVQIDTLQGANGKDGTNGKDGEDGTNGVDGKNGADGNRFFFGAYDPENIPANEGDIFLDTRTYDLYAYGSGWAVIGNIKGTTGANGQEGINGLNGTNGKDGTNGTDSGDPVIYDAVPPSFYNNGNVGQDGDMWIDVTNHHVYMKETGLWYDFGVF